VTTVSTAQLKQPGVTLESGFTELSKKVSSSLQKALSSDQKIVILGGDCDNLAPATLIYFLIDQYGMSYAQAYGHLKERRITIKLIDM
jgi:hypothetical protein